MRSPGSSGRQLNPSPSPHPAFSGQVGSSGDCLDTWVRETEAEQCSRVADTAQEEDFSSPPPAHSLPQQQALPLHLDWKGWSQTYPAAHPTSHCQPDFPVQKGACLQDSPKSWRKPNCEKDVRIVGGKSSHQSRC